jgi:hypothetical protein
VRHLPRPPQGRLRRSVVKQLQRRKTAVASAVDGARDVRRLPQCAVSAPLRRAPGRRLGGDRGARRLPRPGAVGESLAAALSRGRPPPWPWAAARAVRQRPRPAQVAAARTGRGRRVRARPPAPARPGAPPRFTGARRFVTGARRAALQRVISRLRAASGRALQTAGGWRGTLGDGRAALWAAAYP